MRTGFSYYPLRQIGLLLPPEQQTTLSQPTEDSSKEINVRLKISGTTLIIIVVPNGLEPRQGRQGARNPHPITSIEDNRLELDTQGVLIVNQWY